MLNESQPLLLSLCILFCPQWKLEAALAAGPGSMHEVALDESSAFVKRRVALKSPRRQKIWASHL